MDLTTTCFRRVSGSLASFAELGPGRLPIAAIEAANCRFETVSGIEAAEVDAPAIRVGSGLVKALDPAGAAEQMLGCASAKSIGGQAVPALQQFEAIMWHIEVQIARLRADRTIAIEQFERRLHHDGKANLAAMAAALQPHSTVTDFARLRG